MKSILKNVIVVSLLATAPLMAETASYSGFDGAKALIGFEGGYSNAEYSRKGLGNINNRSSDLGYGGIKIGAETQSYRFFIGARVYDGSDFDSALSYGVELQYLMHFSSMANMFIGINGGMVDMELIDSGLNNHIEVNEPYLGADIGFNIHLGDSTDLEVGAKYMSIDSTVAGVNSSYQYTFDNMITGYASIIFKFKAD